MIRILVNGACGRMGQEVIMQAKESSLFQITCGVDCKADTPTSFPLYSSLASIQEPVDVIIDFSIPEASLSILEYAKKQHIPIVIATTGFTENQKQIIEEASHTLPIFQSANMSYEIHLMASLLRKAARSLPDSDIEIVETHHRNKVDAPSGTALFLADSLQSSMEYCYDRHARREKRPKNEIGISSIRGGTEAGKHSVLFLGEHETLEITHTVTSRAVFAKGALKAAEFLVNQKDGLYSMEDLIL